MKDGLENIDELFKQTFDGFESNVDPSVWNNVQSSISSGGTTPQVDLSTVTTVAGKSIAAKIVAGLVLVGAVGTGAYFVPDLFEDKAAIVTENVEPVKEITNNTEEKNKIVVIEEELSEQVKNDNPADDLVESEKVNVVQETVLTDENGKDEVAEGNVVIESSNTLSSDQTNSSEESKPQKSRVTKTDEPVKTAEKTTEFSVNINVDVAKGKAPLTVQFDAYGEGVEQFFWDFSDDSEQENQTSPVHVFRKEGTYTVKLTGIDNLGNTKETYATIVVEKNYTSSISPIQNVITPNGDGENDIIKIKGVNIDRIQVQVLNSNGRPVYFMNSLDDVWDGKDQSGNVLEQGQYAIIVVAIGKDGEKHQKRQMINLLK